MRRLAELLSRRARDIRRMIGAPDYDCYLAHAREAHAGDPPLTREEFTHDALTRRYERPGSRCC